MRRKIKSIIEKWKKRNKQGYRKKNRWFFNDQNTIPFMKQKCKLNSH